MAYTFIAIVYATNVIYSRIIALQASKSTSKRHLHVETLHTDQDNNLNTVSSDGSAMLLIIPWPGSCISVNIQGSDFGHQEG